MGRRGQNIALQNYAEIIVHNANVIAGHSALFRSLHLIVAAASNQRSMEKGSILSSTPDLRWDQQMDILAFLNWLLCRLGLHDYQLVEATFGFGDGGSVERDQCRRCGKIRLRRI